MNNHERELWISNDELLYLWWKDTRQTMRTFIRENRIALDEYIALGVHKRESSRANGG